MNMGNEFKPGQRIQFRGAILYVISAGLSQVVFRVSGSREVRYRVAKGAGRAKVGEKIGIGEILLEIVSVDMKQIRMEAIQGAERI